MSLLLHSGLSDQWDSYRDRLGWLAPVEVGDSRFGEGQHHMDIIFAGIGYAAV
jgi:hypothetical protein